MINDAGLKQGNEPQLHRRWVTPGIGHQASASNSLTVAFGQPIDRLNKQFRTLMYLAVPLIPLVHIIQPKISRQIDHFDSRFKQCRHMVHGNARRSCQKNHVTVRIIHIDRINVAEIAHASETWKKITYSRSGFPPRSDHSNGGLLVSCQQPQQFKPGIARATNNADVDHDVS